MTHRPRLRTLIATGVGTALLALSPGLLVAAPANAAPAVVMPVHNPNYPLGGDTEHPGAPQRDQRAEKAEKLGGNTVTKLIEMGANILKCGLNIVAPTVKCE
ncbi:hypothetical protein [Nocardia veterana]|uniref:DUF732 domain-containing protein n=1 Tax=Nocardia veterana TaxID=132249 RepID=A0A7X6RK11_9NOCA|nr:hypothetical protein [Nocardia veterana]NKY88822.1 hypothetical protein [Nocardia veterana]